MGEMGLSGVKQLNGRDIQGQILNLLIIFISFLNSAPLSNQNI